MGRPRTVTAPPCPDCRSDAQVTSHSLKPVEGEPRRAFRCAGCKRVFIPGVEASPPSPDLKEAVRRVRAETGVPYRLIADAITRNLGVSVSHTTIRAWCHDEAATARGDESPPCEYLSVLWALQREIQAEGRTSKPSR